MRAFNDLSIRGKILSVLVFGVAMQLVASLAAVYFLRTVDTRLNTVVDVDTEKMQLAWRINTDLLEIHRAQKNLIMLLDSADIEKFSGHLTRYQRAIEEDINKLKGQVGHDERGLILRFMEHYDIFAKANREIEALVRSDQEAFDRTNAPRQLNAKAVELSMGRSREAYNEASDLLMEVADRMNRSLESAKDLSQSYVRTATAAVLALSLGGLLLGCLVGGFISRSISRNLNAMVAVAEAIARGNLSTRVEAASGDETGKLAASIADMQSALWSAREEADRRDWLKTGLAHLNDAMRGAVDVAGVSTSAIREVSTYLDARVGAIYVENGKGSEPELVRCGEYAFSNGDGVCCRFKPGSGLVGEAALQEEPLLIDDIPNDYVKVASGLGDALPKCLSLTPLRYRDETRGVMELGFLKVPSDIERQYLRQAMSIIAVNIETVRGREELAKALARSQALSEELMVQQEELRTSNQALEEQTQLLEQSQERLEVKQQELEYANAELEEKNKRLEEQAQEIELANEELERSRSAIEEKAQQVEVASRYKSEFMANMSHELRTPLNSMLLLARLLSDNREKNLTEEQVKSAEIIYGSGSDLLSLINEILDLSKIEAGRMETRIEDVSIHEVAGNIRAGFEVSAGQKGFILNVQVSENAPGMFRTDKTRLEQILRNLVSNAVKFTEVGAVGVRFDISPSPLEVAGVNYGPGEVLSIAVSDTGPGIPKEKQEIIFEAFQQLDSGISRMHGGTGLGLSISRQLAKLLGGEIRIESELGKGSTFILYIPVRRNKLSDFAQETEPESPKPQTPKPRKTVKPSTLHSQVADDRETLSEADTHILIIEDDLQFARLLLDLCHEKGHKAVIAASGEEGLELASRYRPRAAMLDIHLPGIDGWEVLAALKEDPALRHIPVHLMSVDETASDTLAKCAVGYLRKPVSQQDLETALLRLSEVFQRRMSRLLLVEDDELLRESLPTFFGNDDLKVDTASTAKEALHALKTGRFDCMVLDLGLPDMDGLELLKVLKLDSTIALPPVIVYTGRDLDPSEEKELKDYCQSVILKGDRSEERLLDEACLFLHRSVERMPEQKRKIIADLHDIDVMFRGKRVLIVDDDMRNVFALSKILEDKGITAVKAENGKRALDLLEKDPNVDLILMDIMMPEMDGYEAMRRLRAMESFRKVPIIALTAKAMAQDKDLCIAAGASDYLAKPVEVKRLFSMMRVWMY